jgi:excisionase family DNA binding protein
LRSAASSGLLPVCPETTQETGRLLTAREIAELLAVPESWVREHTRNGSLPRVRLGRYIRYRRDAVLAWLDSLEDPASQRRPTSPTTPESP